MNARKLSPFILVILAAVATLAAEGDCETRNDPAGPEPTPAVSSTSESTPASEPGSPLGRLLSGGGTVADVVDRVLPGVVKVISPPRRGTGFFISPDGLVVTNRHVVGGAKSVTIELLSGKRLRGRVTFTHRSLDLAHVQIEARGHYTAIPVGDSDSVRLGEEVIAIGYPLGRMLGDEPTVSVGIVSAKRDNLLQTDAALNPGNSGGPLVNTDGEVVGVVVSRLEEDRQGRPIAGIGFAIPINEVDAKAQGITQAPTPTPDPNATPTPTPEPTPTPAPYWDVKATTDPVTEEVSVMAATRAVEYTYVEDKEPPVLMFHCTNSDGFDFSGPYYGIFWGFNIGSHGNPVIARVKWDDEESTGLRWAFARRGTYGFRYAEPTIAGFIEELLSHETAYIRVENAYISGSQFYAKFELARLKEAIGDEIELCGVEFSRSGMTPIP